MMNEKLNSESENDSFKWYAVYTKPKWEKKINLILQEKNIESWCPVQKVQKQWSDRKKIIEEPLFRSYVFVKINYAVAQQRIDVLQVDGVLRFVYYLKKPAVIREREINNIRLFLNDKNAKIEVISASEFEVDTKVVISKGVFMDKKGTVLRKNSKRVFVALESLGQIMTVEFPIDALLPDFSVLA